MEITPPAWITLDEDEFRDQYPSTRSASFLHRALVRALKTTVARWPSEGTLNQKPLVVDLNAPLPSRLRFYMYEATQHASERQQGTFKVQLTKGIARQGVESARLYFDRTENVRPVLVGYNPGLRMFIIWDAELHDVGDGFPFSKNVQAPPDIVWNALARGLAWGTRRLKRPSATEAIVAARPLYLAEALELRIRLSNESLREGIF